MSRDQLGAPPPEIILKGAGASAGQAMAERGVSAGQAEEESRAKLVCIDGVWYQPLPTMPDRAMQIDGVWYQPLPTMPGQCAGAGVREVPSSGASHH